MQNITRRKSHSHFSDTSEIFQNTTKGNFIFSKFIQNGEITELSMCIKRNIGCSNAFISLLVLVYQHLCVIKLCYFSSSQEEQEEAPGYHGTGGVRV